MKSSKSDVMFAWYGFTIVSCKILISYRAWNSYSGGKPLRHHHNLMNIILVRQTEVNHIAEQAVNTPLPQYTHKIKSQTSHFWKRSAKMLRWAPLMEQQQINMDLKYHALQLSYTVQ